MAHTTKELLDSVEAALQFLQANHATMPLDALQRTRGESMALCTALLNDEGTGRADFDRAYELILELDRVGY